MSDTKQSPFRKAWRVISYAAGAYAVYNQLRSLIQAKNELYANLTPEQQLMWQNVFGKPAVLSLPNIPPPVSLAAPATPIEHVKAGT